MMEETPRKEILMSRLDRVSIDDYTSLGDKDCYTHIIRYISQLKKVEEKLFHDLRLKEIGFPESDRILTAIETSIDCAVQSRIIRSKK